MELDAASHTFYDGVYDGDVLDVVIGADAVFCEWDVVVTWDGLGAAVFHLEVIFYGTACDFFEDVIGGAEGAGEGAVFDVSTIDGVEVNAVAK